MFVLFETAQGYAIFRLLKEKKLEKVDKISQAFQKGGDALNKVIALHHFEKFTSTTEAVKAATSLQDNKLGRKLKKAIKKSIINAEITDETVAVCDPKLGTIIKEKYDINCMSSSVVQELMSLIRSRVSDLVPEWSDVDNEVMQLGVSHGIGRYKLRFSPEKVDLMIIQAVSLIDDIDKELNNYVMRCREWYGWHYPELSKIITQPLPYVKTILAMGPRTNASDADFSDVIEDEETISKIREYAEISMGTDVTDDDIENIKSLCENIVGLFEYRAQLFDYLKNRMMTIAPNLTVLVGELVGARLISHAGSLMNLAKHPASTIQILGAEKALFRALKTKHDTPKYGLIYHAHLVGQSSAALKGKMSRSLAAKAALAARVDALAEDPVSSLGTEHRAKLEVRLKMAATRGTKRLSGGPITHKSKRVKLSE